MEGSWQESINRQRRELSETLSKTFSDIAQKCALVWPDRDKLNSTLRNIYPQIPYCTYLYALTPDAVQVSDNISQDGLLAEHFGRDRSDRPYIKEMSLSKNFLLSDAYISLNAGRPSLTALQLIKKDDEILGIVCADFDLRNLPITTQLYPECKSWRQIKGDPAIRGTVFQQSRTESVMDQNIDQFFSILEELFTQRGMFQNVIHFSSSRATVWVMDDPYSYRILEQDALKDTDICMAYPLHSYSSKALIPKEMIEPILSNMKKLRFSDETFYLRSASINIFNGLISLTFSCDGSHYMNYREFMKKDISFWYGGG